MDYMKYSTIQVIKKTERSEVVFAAVDELDVPVVVKRLQDITPEIYQSIAKIRNPHIPRIYCVEEQGQELCIVEEYIDGKTLDVYLAEESLTDLQKLELMVQLCEALEALHLCTPKIIHRDIKPSNILITADGVLKIIDFDASRQYKTEKNTGDTRLLGTIEYAAPEQFGYAQTDVRSDIYSVGVVFNEIKIEKGASFAGALKRLIDKCTSFDPENRYKEVSEVKRDLEKCIRKGASGGKKKWVIPVAAGVILFVMLLAGRIRMQDITKDAEQTPPTPTMNSEEDRSVLIENRFNVTEKGMPVTVAVREGAPYGIKTVYICSLAGESAPYSEMIEPVETNLYLLVEDGRTLSLGKDFFGVYKEQQEIVLYLEFEDGRGERVWLTCEDTEEETCTSNPERTQVTYKISDLTYWNSYNLDYEIMEDGSLFAKYDEIYAEVMFCFPEEIDMSKCSRVEARVKSEAGNLAIKLYDEAFNELYVYYNIKTNGMQMKVFNSSTKEKIAGIGFMTCDEGLTDYSQCEASIESVTFYMEE